ncbi:MAG: 4Fe-4S dicluster domain-containing protein [Syntrophobacteraceae bacterium]
MVVDQRRCVGCMACIMACKTENVTPPGLFRTRVVEVVSGEFPDLRMELRSELCNHCKDPPCVSCCPTGASFKAKDGIVEIRRNRCVGCRVCIAACPYDARFVDPKGYVDKCSFCSHLVRKGKEPACVATCIGGSRVFGDLDDPNSPVVQLLKESQATVLLDHSGARPQVFYIR